MTAGHKPEKGRRLDELLVRRGLFASRSRARDAIERATVRVGGVVARKPGAAVAEDGKHRDRRSGQRLCVTRAALKLIAGLDCFGLEPAGSVALDIGASTGGFTQVLLGRGAAKVFAVDVGHDQMDASLRADPRVIREGVNARALIAEHLDGEAPDFLVCDVSFISLKLALPPALSLAAAGAKGVFLVKPQFEAGREAIGKGGILRNPDDGPRVAGEIAEWLDGVPGWRVLGLRDSPIAGGDGNREFLLGGIKDRP